MMRILSGLVCTKSKKATFSTSTSKATQLISCCLVAFVNTEAFARTTDSYPSRLQQRRCSFISSSFRQQGSKGEGFRSSVLSEFPMSTSSTEQLVLVPIADGSEEIETACITDTLTRFGAKVCVASVKPNRDLICTMSRGLKVVADCSIEDAAAMTDSWDMIVLPGGMPGAEHLRDSVTLRNLLERHAIQQLKPYGAICAAPAVVLASSIGDKFSFLSTATASTGAKTATCYPTPVFRNKLSEAGMVVSNENVVVSGNLITSQGPATALEFSLRLGEVLYGPEKREEIANAMLAS
jgi:protein deglycase